MTRGEVKQAVEAAGVMDTDDVSNLRLGWDTDGCCCNFEEVEEREKPSEHLLQVLRVADREIEFSVE